MATALLDAPVAAAELEAMLDREPAPGIRYTDPLLAILAEHEIPIYRPEAVTSYKAAMVKQTQRRGRLIQAILGPVPPFEALIFGCAVMFYATAAVSPAYGLGACVLTFGLFVATYWIYKRIHIKRAEWIPYTLTGYTGPIPTEAAARIECLRAAAVKVDFKLEEFQVNLKPLDPLLSVTSGGPWYCIAAWDEPALTAALMH